jgi:hypothetical protein
MKGYIVRGTAPGDVPHEEHRETIGAAASTWLAMERLGASRVRIFAVAEDGSETPLPTYEEALETLEKLRLAFEYPNTRELWAELRAKVGAP